MLAAHSRGEKRMRRALATLVVLSLVMALLAGGFTSVPSARADSPFTVTFNSQSGTPTPAPITGIVSGATVVTLPTAPTLAGSTFNGWFTAVTGGDAFTATTAVTADITVYAQWTATTPATYKVTFNSQSGTPTPAPITGIVSGATVVTLPTAPTLAGSTFNGWFTAVTGGDAFTATTAVTADITVYAQWTATTPATYKVTFNSQSG